jgi:hypothetical protein
MTVQNLKVVRVDEEMQVLMVKGAYPWPPPRVSSSSRKRLRSRGEIYETKVFSIDGSEKSEALS